MTTDMLDLERGILLFCFTIFGTYCIRSLTICCLLLLIVTLVLVTAGNQNQRVRRRF